MLVGKESLEIVLSDMVPDGEEDELVKKMELNLVAADKAKIVGSIWVDGYHKTVSSGTNGA